MIAYVIYIHCVYIYLLHIYLLYSQPLASQKRKARSTSGISPTTCRDSLDLSPGGKRSDDDDKRRVLGCWETTNTRGIPSKLGGGFKYLLFSPRKLGKIPILTNIFEMAWNHQLEIHIKGNAQRRMIWSLVEAIALQQKVKWSVRANFTRLEENTPNFIKSPPQPGPELFNI